MGCGGGRRIEETQDHKCAMQCRRAPGVLETLGYCDPCYDLGCIMRLLLSWPQVPHLDMEGVGFLGPHAPLLREEHVRWGWKP